MSIQIKVLYCKSNLHFETLVYLTIDKALNSLTLGFPESKIYASYQRQMYAKPSYLLRTINHCTNRPPNGCCQISITHDHTRIYSHLGLSICILSTATSILDANQTILMPFLAIITLKILYIQ